MIDTVHTKEGLTEALKLYQKLYSAGMISLLTYKKCIEIGENEINKLDEGVKIING